MRIFKKYRSTNKVTLFNGDCKDLLKSLPDESVDLIITSPPYCIGKAYEDPHDDLETFKKQHEEIFPEIYRVLKTGGSVCWQVGYHISETFVIPLDYVIYELFTSLSQNTDNPFVLRNRIIWTFGHGLNSFKRFSGRHEQYCGLQKGLKLFLIWMMFVCRKNIQGKSHIRASTKENSVEIHLGKIPLTYGLIPCQRSPLTFGISQM